MNEFLQLLLYGFMVPLAIGCFVAAGVFANSYLSDTKIDKINFGLVTEGECKERVDTAVEKVKEEMQEASKKESINAAISGGAIVVTFFIAFMILARSHGMKISYNSKIY